MGFSQGTLPTTGLGVLAILLTSSTLAMDTHVDPTTGRIRTLLGGFPSQGAGWPAWAEVFLFAMEDPRFDVRAPVPHLGLDNPSVDLVYSRRVARIYMPRTYEAFLDNTDLIVLANIDLRVFTPENIAWFRDSVLNEGLGLLMTGGSQGFGAYGGFPSWADTVLNDILPVDCSPGEQSKSYLVKFRIVDPENELAQSIPWEEAPCFFPYNFVTPRQGCKLIIVSRNSEETPLYFYWDIGEGRFVGVQNIFGVFGCDFMNWAYFQDSVLNVYYYTVAVPLPPDPLVAHELRRKWHEFDLQKKLLISLVEFADRFGANLRQVEEGVRGVEALKKSADQIYLDHDLEAALQGMRQAISEAEQVGVMAMRAKDRVFIWVYLIEWLTVSGVLITSGVVLWTLMVRRKAYKEVGLTRGLAS